MHFQDDRNSVDAGDRRSVASEIETEIIVKRRVDGGGRAGQEKHVAISWRTHDCLGREVGASTWSIIYDDRLTRTFGQPLSYQARDDVELSPGGEPTIKRTGRDG